MPARPLRVAVLGVGNIGMVHLQSAMAIDEVEVVAAADAIARHRELAREWGVDAVYDDYATLLAEARIDAAVVALPPFLHRDAVERAADAGVDVFVEKPFARSVAEADAMLDAAEEAGIAVGVDHTIRYQPDLRAVRRAYDDGRVGHVPYATVVRLNNGAFGRPPVSAPPVGWMLDPEAAGGGALLELGVHLFDVIEWLFGPVDLLDAHLDAQLELPVEDAATVIMRAQSTGTVITLHCGTYQWEDLPEVNTTVRLEGVAGTIDNRDHVPSNFYAHAATASLENVRRRLTGAKPAVYAPTFYLQAHHDALVAFFEAIRAGETPPVDGEVGRRCVSLVEQAYDLAGGDESVADRRESVTDRGESVTVDDETATGEGVTDDGGKATQAEPEVAPHR